MSSYDFSLIAYVVILSQLLKSKVSCAYCFLNEFDLAIKCKKTVRNGNHRSTEIACFVQKLNNFTFLS